MLQKKKILLISIFCLILILTAQTTYAAFEKHPLSKDRQEIVWKLLYLLGPFILGLGLLIVLTRNYMAPFYAFWDYFRITPQDTKVIATLAVILFLSLGACFLFRLKNKKIFLAGLVATSFFLNILAASLTIDLTKQYDIGFPKNFSKSITNTFLGERPARFQIEYYWDISKVKKGFIADYPNLIGDYTDPSWKYLSAHGSHHPPGPALFLWLLSKMGLGALGQSLVIILLGSLSAALVYLLALRLFDERIGRAAAFLFIFSPSIILYSATSVDIIFMFLNLLAVYFFIRALEGKRLGSAFLSGLFFSVLLFFNFVNLIMFLFFGLIVLFYWKSIKHLALKMIFFFLGLAIFHGFFIVFFDYNLPLVFYRTYMARWHIPMLADVRPYFYWVPWGSFVQYFTFLGLPFIWFVLLHLKKTFIDIKNRKFAPSDLIFLATFAVYFVIHLLSRGELSRILLFLAPLFVISLTYFISNIFKKNLTKAVFLMSLVMLIETIVIEILLNTYW